MGVRIATNFGVRKGMDTEMRGGVLLLGFILVGNEFHELNEFLGYSWREVGGIGDRSFSEDFLVCLEAIEKKILSTSSMNGNRTNVL